MIKFLKYCLLFLLTMVLGVAIGQKPTPKEVYLDTEITERKINAEKWKEITKEFDYSDALKQADKTDRDSSSENTGQEREVRSGSDQSRGGNSPFLASFFKILFIVVVVVVVALLLLNVMGQGGVFAPRNRKVQRTASGYSIEDIENNLHESDLERFIREAINDKNYALAIRGYYLAIIKELSLNKAIKWKRDKTNYDYLREMKQSDLFQLFREVTRIFEKVWYGEENLGEEEYLAIIPKFESLFRSAQKGREPLKSV